MQTVIVEPNGAGNTHNASLTDGIKKIGFIFCDSNSAYAPYSISRSPIQRVAIKTSVGSQKYGDMEPPWIPIAQDDWSGGRGLEDHEDDSTRYFDAYRTQSAFKWLFNGPMEHFSDYKSEQSFNTNYPDSVKWVKLSEGTSKYIAVSFTPAYTYTAASMNILVRRRGTPKNAITISLCENNAGDPGAAIRTQTISTTEITDTISEFRKVTFAGASLTAGTTYWVKVNTSITSEIDYWEVGVKAAPGSSKKSNDDIIYSAYDYDLYYKVSAANSGCKNKFFIYRRVLFRVKQQDTGTPKLYINGDIGVADSNSGSLTKVIDATKSWTTNYWAGAIVCITGGKGFDEEYPYRTIVSNTATELVCDTAWTVTHDTTTEYAIVNSPHWTEITGHGLTAHVTDICIINNIVYFAQGDYVPIRRMRWTAASGYEYSDESYNAKFLCVVRNEFRGTEIWRAQNCDSNGAISVSRSSITDWRPAVTLLNQTTAITTETPSAGVDFSYGDSMALRYKIVLSAAPTGTNHPYMTITIQESDDNAVFTDVATSQILDAAGTYYMTCYCQKRYRRALMKVYGTNPSVNTFSITSETNLQFVQTIPYHDNYGRINNLIEFPEDGTPFPWVLREGMWHVIRTDQANTDIDYSDTFWLPEISTVMEANNGSAAITSNVYMYVSVGEGIQRYYNNQLDGDGPDKDSGLPTERKGIVKKMLGYPSMYFAAIDAGPTGYSSVLINNQAGYNEIFRCHNVGERINDMIFQTINGNSPDRLWISIDDEVIWLAMPSKTIKAINDTSAEYTHESTLISSWMFANMMNVQKTWNSLTLTTENLDENNVTIECDYQTDEDDKWIPISTVVEESPVQEILLKDNTQGRRLRYRLRMMTNDKTKTPLVKNIVTTAIGTVDVKYSFSFPYRNLTRDVNLQGEYEDITPKERQAILDEWAKVRTFLILNTDESLFDNQRVYLEAPSISPIGDENYIGRVTVNQI